MLKQMVKYSSYVVWVLLLLFLPITSMPLVIKLTGSSTVGAPSILFLLLLLLIWLLPYIINGGGFHFALIPLLGFVSFAIVLTALSNFYNIPIIKNSNIYINEISAIFTLFIGVSFYIATSAFPSTGKWINTTYKLINISGLLIIIWCAVQAYCWFVYNSYPTWIWRIHELYSVGPLYRQRITGFALEPSWLAHQLNLIYIPIWLSSSVTGYTAFKYRIWKVSFENIFLIAGITMLLLTFSRVGLLSFLLMLAYLGLRINLRFIDWIKNKIIHKYEHDSRVNNKRDIFITALIIICMIIIYVLAIVGIGIVFSKIDPRMESLFNFEYGVDNPLLRYAEKLTFASRLVYWDAGWKVFRDFPWTGVGLGNAGFFFYDRLSPYAWKLEEIRLLVYHSSEILNTKSLWVRILAETGIIGFAFFNSWIIIHWFISKRMITSTIKKYRMAAYFGVFVILGMIVEGFSIDTFALPYYWVSLGLLISAHKQYKILENSH